MAKNPVRQWLRLHVSDSYVRKARQEGYRSRAAREPWNRPEALSFQTWDDRARFCAAPGGWSQVAAQKVMPGGRVVAIDVLEMAPISGVTHHKRRLPSGFHREPR